MSNRLIEDGPRASPVPSKFSWRGTQALKRVYALNERCLEVLTQLARTERRQISLVMVHQHRAHWRSLNVPARKRAARTPFLLMDVHFQDPAWWRGVQDPRPHRRRKAMLETAFTGKIADELMRETLMLAWSTVILDRGAASFLLGMAPTVSSIIAEFGPQDVHRIAARYSRHLRPRWPDYPAFWGKLLTAAQEGDDDALYESRLHGVQLIGGELLPLLEGRFV